ncbi:titin [Drosophila yakuba]|uniref:Titin n=1 Tax=Drosophila yakuba TaxID=7245 RepID=B4PQL6_DROYA|nr:titin [Drosophila yakuba]XP_039231679.1 titin [Drosophila yakuba]EDW97312.2 uncharacterized protein Dyak_GE26310 [Drosophila yakuba]
MSLDGARLRYEDENGKTVVLAAKGRTFQVGSYYNCDLILEGPEEERLICEINCDAFGRVIIYNKSSEDPIHLNDAAINAAGKRPLLHGGKITIRDKVYTWEFPKSSEVQDAPCTPERLLPNEQASNSCPSLKQSHRLQAEKRLTVHNFHYSINSDDEGNTSIESRDQNESHLEEVSLNESNPPTTEEAPCESPKVNLLESTQNKENTATPPGSHQKLLKLCAMSDVVITSFSPRETGVKIEKSFTCVRKPGYTTTSLAVSTPKSVYSTPKGGVLSELNEDSCSRDLMDFSTPSTSKKTKRESSMFLIDLTTPSKLRQTPQQTPGFKHTPKQTPISVDSTDESSDASPIVIDITNADTPPSPSPSHRCKTPQRQAGITGATPKRTPQSLMKRALLTSTKKQIAANQPVKTTPLVTPKRPSLLEARRHCLTTPRRLPFHPQRRTPVQREGQARGNAPKTSPRKRISLMESPRENKVSQLRKSFAAAKRSPGVDKSNKLVAKARRSLNSPKCGSPKPGSSMPSSPCSRKAIDVPQINSSTPEKPDDSKDELSRTFTIMDDTQGKDQSGAVLAIEAVTALVTGEVEDDVSFQLSSLVEKGLPSVSLEEPTPVQDKVELSGPETDAEGKEDSSQDDLNPKPDGVIIEENECELESFVKNELEIAKNQEECKQDEEEIVTSSTTVDEQLEEAVIEDSICEEVHANIPEQIPQNGNSEKVIEESICEELPSESRSTEETSQKKDQPTPNADTPVVRRSLRRLSVEQRVTATTPRRSTRRSSMEASSKPLPEIDNKRSRRASCSAMDSQDVVTPRRKRRFTQELSTPTRQSMRLLNTPKRALQVDESVGDMGVILEEVGPEDDNKSAVADDENYGNELPADDIDKVDYHGLRDLLKTPKSCSTPRFKGLREMMRTPKIPASPILGNMAELLETSVGRTPYHERRSIAVARMEQGKLLDNVLKTPSARNIMVPNEPASAVLNSRKDSLATTTEYDLNMTNNTLHLDKIFDDVPETTAANMEDTETEINVTTISNATGVDPLGSSKRNETVTSEALMSVGQTAKTRDSLKDPLTSTTYKATMQANLSVFAECGSRSFSPNPNEMSGIQLLDQTSDSMFSEALVVSAVESCEVTVDETRTLGQTKPPTDNIEDRSDTDSNVGLTEPLVFSDDEEPKEAESTSKKSDAAQETSIACKTEDSFHLAENKTANETLSKYENDAGTISEISLIEVEDSTIEGSKLEGDKLQERNTLDIETANSDNTEAPLDENIESAVVDSTILESEVFPLDTTADSSINSTYVLNSSLEKTKPDHDLKQEVCKSTSDDQATAITPEKSFTELDRSVANVSPSNKREVNTDDPPIEISPKELAEDTKTAVEHIDDETSKPPIEHYEELSEESEPDKVSTAAESDQPETLPSPKDTPAESKQPFTESHSDELVHETNCNEVSIDGEVIKPAIETLPFVEQKQVADVSTDAEPYQHCIKSSPLNEVSEKNQTDEVHSSVRTDKGVEPYPVKEVLKETKADEPIQPVIEANPIEELQEEAKPDEAPSVSDSPVKGFIETKAVDDVVIESSPEEEPLEEACPDKVPPVCVSDEVAIERPPAELSVKENPIDKTTKPTIGLPDLSEIDQVNIEKSPAEELPEKSKRVETIQPIIETSSGNKDQIEASPTEVSSASKIENLVVETNPQTDELIPPDEIKICAQVEICDTSISKTIDVVSDIDRDKIQDQLSTQNLCLNSSSEVQCVSKAEESLNNSTAAFEIEHSEDVVHATTSTDADISKKSEEKEKMATVPNDVGCANQTSIECVLANVTSDGDASKAVSKDKDELEISTNSSKIPPSCTQDSLKTSLSATLTSQDESAQIDEQDENNDVEEHVVLEESSNEIIAADKENSEKNKENISDDTLNVVEQTSVEQTSLIHQSLTDQNTEVSITEESEAVAAEESMECQVNKDSKTEVIQLDASTIVERDTLDESTSGIEDINQSTEITMPEEVSDVEKIKEVDTMDKEEPTESQHSDQKNNDDEVVLLDASSSNESCTEPSRLVDTHADMEMDKNEAEKCNQSQSDDEVILLDTSSIVDQCSPNKDSLIQDQIEDTIPQGTLIQANDAKESVSEESSNQNGVEEKAIQLDSSNIAQQSICDENSLIEDSVAEPANNISIIAEKSTENEICPKISAAVSSPHRLESQKSELQINQIKDLPEDTTSASSIRQSSSSSNGDLLNVSSSRDIEFPISKTEDKPKDRSDSMADAPEAPTEAEDVVMQESDILVTSSHTDELELHKSVSKTENVSSQDVQSAEDGDEVEEVEFISEEKENIARAAEQKAQPGDPATCSSNSSIGQGPESTAVEAISVIPHEDPADVNQKETDELNPSVSSFVTPSANEPQVVVTTEESADVARTSDGEDATNNLQEKDNIPMEPDTVQEQGDGTHTRPVSEDISAPAVGSDQEMLANKDDAGLGNPKAEEIPSEEPINITSTDSKESKERPDVTNNEVEIPTSEPTMSPEPTEMFLPNRRSSNQEEKSPHEENTKPIKRVTRKGSATADRPAEIERPKRVARKPSAEVLEIEDRSRDTKPDHDLGITSRGRAGKPPSDVNEDKTEGITEKRRGRTRTPSVEVSETTANVEQKKKDDDNKSKEEALQPILEEETEPKVEERIESNAEVEIIIDKPKKRLRKVSSKESDTISDNIENINTDLKVVNEAGSTHSINTEQRDDQDPIVLPAKSELQADLEGERDVQDTNLKQTTKERPKRRGRKASAETDTASEKIEKAEDLKAINEDGNKDTNTEMERQVYMAVIPNTSNEKEKLKTEVLEDVEPKQKRRVRKASAKETNTTLPKREKTEDILAAVVEVESALSSKHNSSHSEQMGPKEPAPVATSNISKEELDPDNVPNVSSEKEVQKELAEDISNVPDKKHKLESLRSIEKQDDVPKETGKTRAERPQRRGRKQSDDIVESSAPNDAHSPEKEKALVSVQEDHPNPADQNIPKKRARKSAELKHATVEDHAKEDHVERPKRRGRKPSVDIDHVVQDVLEKPRRRGRTPAEHESHHVGDEKQEPVVEPAKKTRRIARKASVETVEAVSSSGEEHLQQIDEAIEPVTESATALSELIPQEGEEQKTRRRGRKPTVETVEGSIQNTPTEEPVTLPTHSRRRGRKATEDEALTTAVLTEPKTKVRGRRASLEPEHKVETSAESHQSSEVVELPAAKTTRRGRKPSADIEATSPEKKPASRRVRKASPSVDEEPPATKKTAIRRGRKNEAHEDEEKKQIDLQDLPTEIVSALVVTSGNPSKAADEEELTPRRREGRNLPRKNYEEAPDDDKPHSGLRRARKPAASKALANKASESDPLPSTPTIKQPPVKEESTPDNTVALPEPTTSQRREGRNLPRKNYTEAPDDDKPTPARSRRVRNLTAKALELIVDSSPRPATPKRPKGKGVDVEEPPAKKATPEIPSTTEASGPEEEPLPASKGRGTRRKADHSDLEEPEVKTAKKNIRGAGRKTKVETETEEHPPIKKPRVGSRAKTPSEEAAITLEEEPVKKPAARSRAKGAKTAEPEQPAEDPQVEVTSSKPVPAARGGRGRKVHFEAAPETAASESAPSSQRATRSRRK